MSDNQQARATHLNAARRVLEVEAASVAALSDLLDQNFGEAVEQILATHGRVIVCGMGKSGLIGRKISATLSSTGTPSFFMHPADAYHGDLGMVTPQDVFLAISNSGETDELVKLLPFLNANGNLLVAMTGNVSSSLAKAADCHVNVSVAQEACPLQLAPTSSTTATLAMGDALAVALMDARDFRPEQFARFHPGGTLGRRLLSRVHDVMWSDDLPVVDENESVMGILSAITKARLGVAVVRAGGGWGMVTDGDIRRCLETFGQEAFTRTAGRLMTRDPIAVGPHARTEDALALMDRRQISAVLVLEHGELVGILTK